MEMLTTPQTFDDQLHTYTIVDAINDGNVLPFRIDYVNTVKEKEGIKDKNVSAIDIERQGMRRAYSRNRQIHSGAF